MEPGIAIEIVNDQLVVHFIDSYSHRLQNFEPVWRQIAKDLMELESKFLRRKGASSARSDWKVEGFFDRRRKRRNGLGH